MAETNKQRSVRTEKLDYWRGHIEQWTTSNLPASRYCREQGLVLCQFKYWQERVRVIKQTSLFVEVETTQYQDCIPETERKITLATAKGSSITIHTKQFESDLSSLMRVLSSHSC